MTIFKLSFGLNNTAELLPSVSMIATILDLIHFCMLTEMIDAVQVGDHFFNLLDAPIVEREKRDSRDTYHFEDKKQVVQDNLSRTYLSETYKVY